jgi:hypothetical protein
MIIQVINTTMKIIVVTIKINHSGRSILLLYYYVCNNKLAVIFYKQIVLIEIANKSCSSKVLTILTFKHCNGGVQIV